MMPISPLLPLITIKHFLGGKFEMGLIEVVWSIGMLAGSVVVAAWRPRLRSVVIINLVNIVAGVSLASSGFIPSHLFLTFVGLIGLSGVAYAIQYSYVMTVVQQRVKQEVLGRVFSIFFSIAILPAIVGLVATGFMADFIGINHAFVILGALVAAVGGISFIVPPLMAIGRDEKT